jgi:CrcB protein
LREYVTVAVGGALGATARSAFGNLALAWFGARFPWGTFGVIVLGSFAIGLVGVLAIEFGQLSGAWRQFLIVGILGGFTTFSSLSCETSVFLRAEDYLRATTYLTATLAAGFAAVFVGIGVARAVH